MFVLNNCKTSFWYIIDRKRFYSHPHLTTPETRVTGLHIFLLVYLHSNSYSGLQKMHVQCNKVHNGHSRSFKVTDVSTNRKHVCDFLSVINSNLGLGLQLGNMVT